MIAFILRRLLQAVPTLLAVVTVSFFLMRLAPGGPFDLERPLAPAALENLRRVYGLDRPLIAQFGSYLAALARGDGDMALQLVCEILDRPETELVGPLPPELNASIDADAAMLADAPHPKAAADYLLHITQPESAAIWASKGLVRK